MRCGKRIWRESSRRSRDRAREYVDSAKGGPCVDCGDLLPPYCMDFDHVRGDKVDNLARMVSNGTGIEKIQQEIDKCDLVCANCHRKRTHGGVAEIE